MSIKIDTTKTCGKIKPMHAVNNGPVLSVRSLGNAEDYALLNIPYARNHDAAFCSSYGGYHTVDVAVIFPDFDADENDPASYDFPITDKYVRETFGNGTKMFYRLGAKIEHEVRKYNVNPPKDFSKWARICEHIIRHYTEGWADGYRFDLEYWEIWNEPDLIPQCWTGTYGEFFELYATASTYLKKCFPHLKIGGPALTFHPCIKGADPEKGLPAFNYEEEFLKYIKAHGAPLDFYSWHGYSTDPKTYSRMAREVRETVDSFGYTDAELILDEWNYVKGWSGDDMMTSYRTMINEKGAAFIAASFIEAQHSPMTMFMYYDARPSNYNGLWNNLYDRHKGFYAFYAFGQLYKMGTEIASECTDGNVYVLSSTDENGKIGILISAFNDDDTADDITVMPEISGLCGEYTAVFTLTDRDHDGAEMRREITNASAYAPKIGLMRNSVLYIELTKNAQ